MNKKLKIFQIIISIVTPILLVTSVVLIITFGWYIKKQQTANINATTKNVSIEYTFDGDEETNVVNYTVSNLVFFDVDSTDENKIELKYLPTMAVKLELNLKNNSTNDVTYKITFESVKQIATETVSNETVDKSIAYIDCLFYDITSIPNTVTTVSGIKSLTQNGVTYTNTSSTETNRAEYDSGVLDPKIVLEPEDDITITMYIYGVQEIDDAKNSDFLYDENGDLRDYAFSLTIEATPQGTVEVDESSTPLPDVNDGN